MRFKKLAAVLLSAVMLVCCFTVQASAKTILDGAKRLELMETYNFTIKNNAIYCKIVLKDSGILRIRAELERGGGERFTLYDSSSMINEIYSVNCMGTICDTGNIKIKKAGTYYLKIEGSNNITNLYYSFEPDHTPTISLALNAKVGDEFDFSALTSNYKGKVTMKTTDSKVADVDGNIVTCKKAGKAKIRAYMNNGDYAEITLIVKKK